MSNISQMFTNPDSELAFGLSYILMVTDNAGEHIYHIFGGTVAYMMFNIGAFCGCTIKFVSFQKDGRNRALSVITNRFFMKDIGGVSWY